MLHSMTGYGRGQGGQDGVTVRCEVRTLNHRYLDVVVRGPEALLPFDHTVRERVKARLARGRVEVSLSLDTHGRRGQRAEVNEGLLEAYAGAVQQLEKRLGPQVAFDLRWLPTVPGLITLVDEGPDAGLLEQAVTEALDEALEGVVSMRRREGQALQGQFTRSLGRLRELAEDLRRLAPLQVEGIRDRLTRRLEEWLGGAGVDPQRVALEVALLAEKSDIEEELNRLQSHLDQFQRLVSGAEPPIGRQLDFLAQEIHRELNTIGAKSASVEVSDRIVTGKVELERIREQVQNIE